MNKGRLFVAILIIVIVSGCLVSPKAKPVKIDSYIPIGTLSSDAMRLMQGIGYDCDYLSADAVVRVQVDGSPQAVELRKIQGTSIVECEKVTSRLASPVTSYSTIYLVIDDSTDCVVSIHKRTEFLGP